MTDKFTGQSARKKISESPPARALDSSTTDIAVLVDIKRRIFIQALGLGDLDRMLFDIQCGLVLKVFKRHGS